MLEEGERVADQTMQTDLAQHERAGTSVVHQSVQRGRDSLGARDALLDFLAIIGIGGVFQFEFEVRQDAEQRVVDFVRRTQGELCKCGVLFVFSKLGLELNFVLVEFALFVESAEEFFLRDVAFLLTLLRQGARVRVRLRAWRRRYDACARS